MAGGMHGRRCMRGMHGRGVHGGVHGMGRHAWQVGGVWYSVNERAVRILLECILVFVFETNVYLLD